MTPKLKKKVCVCICIYVCVCIWKQLSRTPCEGKHLCSHEDSNLLAELCTWFKMMLSPSVALYVKELLCHGIILYVCVYFHLPCHSLYGCCVCMLNNKPKRNWLRRILGCLWEAGAWILKVSLQLGTMSLLEGLNCSEDNSHSVQCRSVLALCTSSTSTVRVQHFVDRMWDFFFSFWVQSRPRCL